MTEVSHWKKARVAGHCVWTERLFSLQVDAPEIRFTAGQFASLALPAPEGSVEPMLARPYSFVNAPDSTPHEFLITESPQGTLSPRLARLREGDTIWIGNAYGFFVCDEVPAASTLWMMATGTGIAPFLSMLRTDELWRKFERVVLVHGVRWAEERVYPKVIAAVQQEHGNRFSYAPFVSRGALNREKADQENYFSGRITTALADGQLEKEIGCTIDKETTQVMLCGNPAMVEEVHTLLSERGMRRHRQRAPGQITVETYW
ncbi:MAG: ferredoxin--NADP reductase [Proteobacteria bacterium]|nr:ferredoxin--NADP reductase [Pseudomonadota bacterium]MCL2307491.1 ferredoxin--NADP reductase [Pseudomonadota bacterium]